MCNFLYINCLYFHIQHVFFVLYGELTDRCYQGWHSQVFLSYARTLGNIIINKKKRESVVNQMLKLQLHWQSDQCSIPRIESLSSANIIVYRLYLSYEKCRILLECLLVMNICKRLQESVWLCRVLIMYMFF